MVKFFEVSRGEVAQHRAAAAAANIAMIREVDDLVSGQTRIIDDPDPPRQRVSWPDQYAAASNPTERLEVIARFLNLIP